MKKIITTTIAAGLVAGVASAEVSVTADFASAYVFRGVTLNDGAVFQPGIEASGFGLPEEYGSVALGAWANYDFDDYAQNGAVASTFVETDWYVSYGLPTLVDGLDLFVGYCEYMYAGGARDEELNAGMGYEVAGVGLGFTAYKGVGGFIGTAAYYELSAAYGMDFSETLGGEVGARAGFTDYGFSDYDLSAAVSYTLTEEWSIGASLAYIGQGDDKVLGDTTATDLGYDVDVVGMISLACDM